MQEDVAFQRNADVSPSIAIHVAGNDGVAASGELIAKLAGVVGEAMQAMIAGEMKFLLAGKLAIGVNRGEIDQIDSRQEVGDHIAAMRGSAAIGELLENEGIGAIAAGQEIAPAETDEKIVSRVSI
jgi:hypothetical protein